MFSKENLIFISLLQLVVMFALMPMLVINQTFGHQAVLIYTSTSILILCSFALYLWCQRQDKKAPARLGALSFGMIIAFLSAEIVAVSLMLT